jgi:Ca-activated chloride channel family protein
MEFVYYQKLEVDSNVGRYLYPLEEGETDEAAKGFWDMNSTVSGTFSARVELRSDYPVSDVRVPTFGGQMDSPGEGRHVWTYQSGAGASLDQDLVLYYRLQDGLPGRVDLLTYKAEGEKEGTFMLALTPGVDLKPITQGADYMLVLDKSGSMQGKIQTLADGVERALGALSAKDRFQIVVFDNTARELTSDWINVSEESILQHSEMVRRISSDGGTNIYAGLEKAFKRLDADRLTNLILVTDGVTNTGIVDPAAFDKLIRSKDVRLFGFLMGNSANWPLMRLICEAADGTYESISNGDDLYGKILMARDRITTEALLDVDLAINGVKTHSLARNTYRKLYQGKQLVILGRYKTGGKAGLTLKARLTGEDKSYQTDITFPKVDTTYPELERIWAMTQVEALQRLRDLGKLPESELTGAVSDIGVTYQIVTDETSMLLLDDARFQERGIERRNKKRMEQEHAAQQARRNVQPKPVRADSSKPMFGKKPSYSTGGGGGALEGPFVIVLLTSLLVIRRKRARLGDK